MTADKKTDFDIYRYKIIDSTNSEAKRRGLEGIPTPAVFIADAQSGGRGRMGRSFYSPEGTGLYLSLLFAPRDEKDAAVCLTSLAAVAARRAIKTVHGVSTEIKWVNDLYLDGRKVCGILAEAFSFEGGEGVREKRVVIGVGINISTRDFPEELRGKAGSLAESSEGKERLARELIKELLGVISLSGEERHGELMEEYRRHSLVLGRRVAFTENGSSRSGMARSIDDNGALRVILDTGEEKLLSSGEISIAVES